MDARLEGLFAGFTGQPGGGMFEVWCFDGCFEAILDCSKVYVLKRANK